MPNTSSHVLHTKTTEQKTAGDEITVTEFKPLRKGSSLQGFLTLQLPTGMVLHDCSFHERDDGARWIGMPARRYPKPDGESAYIRVVDFTDKESHRKFQKAAVAAVDSYLQRTRA